MRCAIGKQSAGSKISADLEANRHSWQKLFGKANHGLIDITEDRFFNGVVLDNLAQNTAVTAANDQDFLRIWVCVHGQMCDHLLIPSLLFS